MSYEEFAADERTVNAVIFNFLVIGEAVKHLPPSLTGKHPEIPWRQIAGMRDKLTQRIFRLIMNWCGRPLLSFSHSFVPRYKKSNIIPLFPVFRYPPEKTGAARGYPFRTTFF